MKIHHTTTRSEIKSLGYRSGLWVRVTGPGYGYESGLKLWVRVMVTGPGYGSGLWLRVRVTVTGPGYGSGLWVQVMATGPGYQSSQE